METGKLRVHTPAGSTIPTTCVRAEKWVTKNPVSWYEIERRPPTGLKLNLQNASKGAMAATRQVAMASPKQDKRQERIIAAIITLIDEGVLSEAAAWELL